MVLEAFEAGLPVMGSALGGIEELVQHENNGYLVSPYDDSNAWASALAVVANNTEKLDRWRQNVGSPRGMQEACQDMMAVYRAAIEHRAAHV